MQNVDKYIWCVNDFLQKAKLPPLSIEQEEYVRVYLERSYAQLKDLDRCYWSLVFNYKFEPVDYVALSTAVATCMIYPEFPHPTLERIQQFGINKIIEFNKR